MVRDTAMVTMEGLQENTIAFSNGTITDPYDLPSPKMGVPNSTPGPTLRRVLPPGKYARRYGQTVCCVLCHYELSDVSVSQITLALVHSCCIANIILRKCRPSVSLLCRHCWLYTGKAFCLKSASVIAEF